MTELDHLRLMIGDLVMRVAQLAAEVDALKAPPPADPPAEPPA